jgi:hypothetical protein
MTWMKNLKFPNGFVTGFRRVVNLKTGKLIGVKSHDYHEMAPPEHVTGIHASRCVEDVS